EFTVRDSMHDNPRHGNILVSWCDSQEDPDVDRMGIDSAHDLVTLGDLVHDFMMEVRPGSESYCKSLTDTVDAGWKIRELRIVVHIIHRDVQIKCRRIARIDG